MIIRKGFVANSSSSSFICSRCGSSGQDDDDAAYCKSYTHVFCWGCTTTITDGNTPNEVENIDDCPFCKLEALAKETSVSIMEALLKEVDIDIDRLRRRFGTEKELKDHLKNIVPLKGVLKFDNSNQPKPTSKETRRLNLRGQ